ncbi:MAG: hypothetical protein LOX97_04630, partial [Sphingomonas sp.]|nr:hypothetical protein [Sphingomonas sp.]
MLLTLIEYGPKGRMHPSDYDARADIAWSAPQALNGLVVEGVPHDWATHLGLGDERLLPSDPQGRGRAISWLVAALNSVEPFIFELIDIDIFRRGEEWTTERRPQVVETIDKRLKALADALGDKPWFEERFTIGDLVMVTVLRALRHTDLVAGHPRLAALGIRGQAPPALQAAPADQ